MHSGLRIEVTLYTGALVKRRHTIDLQHEDTGWTGIVTRTFPKPSLTVPAAVVHHTEEYADATAAYVAAMLWLSRGV